MPLGLCPCLLHHKDYDNIMDIILRIRKCEVILYFRFHPRLIPWFSNTVRGLTLVKQHLQLLWKSHAD